MVLSLEELLKCWCKVKISFEKDCAFMISKVPSVYDNKNRGKFPQDIQWQRNEKPIVYGWWDNCLKGTISFPHEWKNSRKKLKEKTRSMSMFFWLKVVSSFLIMNFFREVKYKWCLFEIINENSTWHSDGEGLFSGPITTH